MPRDSRLLKDDQVATGGFLKSRQVFVSRQYRSAMERDTYVFVCVWVVRILLLCDFSLYGTSRRRQGGYFRPSVAYVFVFQA